MYNVPDLAFCAAKQDCAPEILHELTLSTFQAYNINKLINSTPVRLETCWQTMFANTEDICQPVKYMFK